jgi:hypothetical protein
VQLRRIFGEGLRRRKGWPGLTVEGMIRGLRFVGDGLRDCGCRRGRSRRTRHSSVSEVRHRRNERGKRPWFCIRSEVVFERRVNETEIAKGGRRVTSGGDQNKGAYCINLSAALVPQGNFRGRSNVFPKSTSSAEMGRRKRPVCAISFVSVAGLGGGKGDKGRRETTCLGLVCSR